MQVIKVPYGVGSMGKNNKTSQAPDKIQETVKEIFCTETQRIPVFKFEEITVDESDMQEAHNQIEKQAVSMLNQATQPVCFLGGDHSITYGLFKAFAQTKAQKDEQGRSTAGMVIVDAHPDLMQGFSPPTHENYLRCLIDDNIIDPHKIILIGVRAWDKEEVDYLKKHNIKHYSMQHIQKEGFNEVVLGIMSIAKEWETAYFSIDIDGVDPAFAPGTGYAEPGGLTSRELIHLIHQLKRLPNIKCYDLVEINAEKDINNLTVKLGAKILAELC